MAVHFFADSVHKSCTKIRWEIFCHVRIRSASL